MQAPLSPTRFFVAFNFTKPAETGLSTHYILSLSALRFFSDPWHRPCNMA